MGRVHTTAHALRDLIAGHRAVAGEMVALGIFDAIDHRPRDLDRICTELLFHRIGTVVA